MKIVISRTDALGDLILTLPLAKFVKEQFPQAHVTFLVNKRCRSLLLNNPYIDDVWALDTKMGFVRRFAFLLKKWRELKPDHFFYIGGSHLTSFIAWLMRSKVRGGLRSRWPSFIFLKDGMRQKRVLAEMHESEYNFELLSPLGGEFNYQQLGKFAPDFIFTEEERTRARGLLNKKLEEAGLPSDRKFIVIHPGMTGHTLNWPTKKYARLIHLLDEHYKGEYTYLISHTPSDKSYMEGLDKEFSKGDYQEVKKRVLYFDGSEVGLRNFLVLLDDCELFVGPSTGPTHMANILGKKQIAIYSPIKVQSSLRWGPFKRDDQRVVVVTPEVVCGENYKCAGQRCLYYECMDKIDVDRVLETAIELLLPSGEERGKKK